MAFIRLVAREGLRDSGDARAGVPSSRHSSETLCRKTLWGLPMRFALLALVFLCLSFYGCQDSTIEQGGADQVSEFSTTDFEQLLYQVAEGWNEGNAQKAAECFSIDAVYIEPPDRQLYRGRQALYEFFGGSSGRASPMRMTWHHLLFDESEQIGAGEYTFSYKGRETHGIVIVQIAESKIRRWREYQYRSELNWEDFVGESVF